MLACPQERQNYLKDFYRAIFLKKNAGGVEGYPLHPPWGEVSSGKKNGGGEEVPPGQEGVPTPLSLHVRGHGFPWNSDGEFVFRDREKGGVIPPPEPGGVPPLPPLH
jgi:hypothetical protein